MGELPKQVGGLGEKVAQFAKGRGNCARLLGHSPRKLGSSPESVRSPAKEWGSSPAFLRIRRRVCAVRPRVCRVRRKRRGSSPIFLQIRRRVRPVRRSGCGDGAERKKPVILSGAAPRCAVEEPLTIRGGTRCGARKRPKLRPASARRNSQRFFDSVPSRLRPQGTPLRMTGCFSN